MISLSGVKKSYQGRCVLNLPSLAFAEGGRYALVGPNGSGKSTLLRILAGVLPPDKGVVCLPPALGASIGYMPQHPYAYGFSVLKNVSIALPRKPGTENHAKAERALERVGLAQLSGARGDRLSGGEAQRMALARMLVRERRLLLLDEPTSATDVAGHDRLERALLDYCAETGCTLIFATHSLAQAARLAERVVVLSCGSVAEHGSAAEVLYHPSSAEAQAFMQYWRLVGEAKPEGCAGGGV